LDGSAARRPWHEWSAESDDLDDRDVWAQVNMGLITGRLLWSEVNDERGLTGKSRPTSTSCQRSETDTTRLPERTREAAGRRRLLTTRLSIEGEPREDYPVLREQRRPRRYAGLDPTPDVRECSDVRVQVLRALP
jgi:hypothetical protein